MKKGFTLIELMIVILILGLCIGIIGPVMCDFEVKNEVIVEKYDTQEKGKFQGDY